MAWVERLVTRASQPQDACGIDWSNPLTRGLERALDLKTRTNLDIAKGASVTHGANILPLAPKPTPYGVGLDAPNSTNFEIRFPSWANITSEASAFLVQSRISAESNQWLELGSGGSADHFPFSGLVYSDAFWSGRWISGVAPPSGKSFISSQKIAFSVKNGSQKAFWDGVPWVSATNSGGFTLPATLELNSGTGFVGVWYLALFWSRALSDFEIKSLSDNPWQIFEPEVTRIWVDDAASVTLPTLVQPSSTTSAGAWTATGAATLHAAINEAVASDTQYISVNSASTTELVLAEAAYPGASNQTLAYRASSTQGSTLTVTLKQGATEIMTRTHALTGTDTLYTQTLTAPEIALITSGAISVTLTTS